MTIVAIIPVASAKDLEAATKATTAEQNKQPVIQGLAAYVRKRWEIARAGKRKVEERMMQCIRQRQMEYDPHKLSQIRSFGGSEIFMGVAASKARALAAWLRDALLGTGADKPWSLSTTPIPDLPPEIAESLRVQLMHEAYQAFMNGTPPNPEQMRELAAQVKDSALRALKEEAAARVARMEAKMEDQLVEGGFSVALSQFLDDLVTFPFAVLKGPVVRKRKTLKWANGGLVPTEELRPEWERVDPFNFYWAPWVSDIQDGFIIERHKLTRDDLDALIGVEGYSKSAIRSVLAEFDSGALREWVSTDFTTSSVEEKDTSISADNQDTVDALQLWDSVPGKLLIEWGLSESEISDPFKSYPCEVWLIGTTVIKAVLNYDPLGLKPYYVTSIEKIPGTIVGNGVCDLVRDAESMCNAVARALANNVGISSGPQCAVNISRIPAGEDITQMYPWKIWQFTTSDYNDKSPPISFFQPSSNAGELMAIYEKFYALADDLSGIPRYMVGVHTPGVGRTSSGLSMLISNANKVIKQVISNIDNDIIVPALNRLYSYNLRYSQDPDLIGDIKVVPKGAMSLVVKEAEAVRRNEFLQIVLNNPFAQQIVGMSGAAELLRDAAKNLNGNVDKIVPNQQYIDALTQAQLQIQQLTEMLQQSMQQQNMNSTQTQLPYSNIKFRETLSDGSLNGGRDSNYISPRPNGI